MPINYRKATGEDNFATFNIFLKSIMDFSKRAGVTGITGGLGPAKINELWNRRQSLWKHLSDTCDQYWLAENENSEAIGYARSIVRDDHRELTEFFVLPGNQSAGVGKELLSRAFPIDTVHRSIIATTDFRAMAQYLKTGVYPFVVQINLERVPEYVNVATDLTFESSDQSNAILQRLGEIDLKIIGHRRDIDHRFLMGDRKLYLYKRNGGIVGYGYIDKDYYGPFALLDDNDFPAVLAYVETQALQLGAETVGFETPMINTVAINYLINRGYRLVFFTSIMSEKPFGSLQNYILTSPPFFL